MTCHLCACGTEIRYSCVKDETVHCTGCGREYTVDKETGKLIPPIKELNLNRKVY